MADNLTPIPVKTKTAGDVDVDINSAPTGASAIEIQGTAADGAAVAGDPVQVGGKDGSGNAQTLATDTDGQLQVDIIAELPAGTQNIGDVDIASELPAGTQNIGDVDIASAPTGASAIEVQGTAADGAAVAGDPVQVGGKDGSGNAQTLSTDTDGQLQVDVLSVAAGDNNIGNVDIATGPTGASALEVQGTAADGAAAAGDPVRVGGTDGSGNVQNVITDTDGHLQVDVLTGGGSDTPTSPATEDVTSAALAAGASADLDSTDVGATTLKLTQVIMAASVPFKARLMTVADAVESVIAVFFHMAGGGTVIWNSPHRDYVQQGAAGAGFDGFRVEMTNMDNADAADVYCSFLTEQ